MRIRAGKYKGRALVYPRSGLRPTKDMTRQAVFNIIGSRVVDARVLDLFAGGGALGIEALSRGARLAVFVEQDAAILRCLRQNTAGLEGASVIRGDALRVLRRLGKQEFDVVLADPPYRQGFVGRVVEAVATGGQVAAGGLLVAEHSRSEPVAAPDGWYLVKHGRYGDSEVTVLRRLDD